MRGTELRRGALIAVVAAVLLGVVVVVGAPGAAALSPIRGDNRPTPLPGRTNGSLSSSDLLQVSPTCQAERHAAPSLVAMMTVAHDQGVNLMPSECYRDLAGQIYWREYWCARSQCGMAAVPGTSNHGWGKAVDFKDQGGGLGFSSAGYLWLRDNAWRYGWNHPDFAQPGGSAPEPWHWEWVGDGGTLYPGLVYPTPMGAGIVIGGQPIGSFEGVDAAGPGRVQLRGWALDPDALGPVNVHLYVDGRLELVTSAHRDRHDVWRAYPGYGPGHGFSFVTRLSGGTHQLCLYAINFLLGSVNPSIGCHTVTVSDDPTGSFDAASLSSTPAGTSVDIEGWAIDPNTTGAVTLHVWADHQPVMAITADDARTDIGAAYPNFGPLHGFRASIPLTHGPHRVCVYAINTGPGASALVGCRDVHVDRDPIGHLDGVTVDALANATVRGWAIDPDSTEPASVHLYLDGRAVAVVAGESRADVGGVFPAWGADHGFEWTTPLTHGPHTLCAFGINVLDGSSHRLLGCESFTASRSPIGTLDDARATGLGKIRVQGWALDTDTPDPITVHLYIDGAFAGAFAANQHREDVSRAFEAVGPLHGYIADLSVTTGVHTVCAYGINVGGGANSHFRCLTVTA